MAVHVTNQRTTAIHDVAGRRGSGERRILRCRAGRKSAKKEQEFVVGGGGYDGACEIDDIKAALENCKGLEGAVMEACWAEYGCSVEKVTRHYAKVAGFQARSNTTTESEASSDT